MTKSIKTFDTYEEAQAYTEKNHQKGDYYIEETIHGRYGLVPRNEK